MEKFSINCTKCNALYPDLKTWYETGQKCGTCNTDAYVKIKYKQLLSKKQIQRLKRIGLWAYFDVLPLNSRNNIVSFGEGNVPIERWEPLEHIISRDFNKKLKIYASRQDFNCGTNTFKDLAGTVVASCLKENKITQYVVASTGNIAVAYARYLAKGGMKLNAFIPKDSPAHNEATIAAYGHNIVRVNGDYEQAKIRAKEFALKKGYLLASGNFDPMRIEAKKTMVYDWINILNDFPTVYIQALSGGTGPLGIQKAIEETREMGFNYKIPKQLLVQASGCAPMTAAWEKAVREGFPQGWFNDYPVLHNPNTKINTLSTGNPKTYPVLSHCVKKSGGSIVSFNEEKVINVTSLVAKLFAGLVGPAAATPIGGFLKLVSENKIMDGEIVMLNVGENIYRSPEFLLQLKDAEKIPADASELLRSIVD